MNDDKVFSWLTMKNDSLIIVDTLRLLIILQRTYREQTRRFKNGSTCRCSWFTKVYHRQLANDHTQPMYLAITAGYDRLETHVPLIRFLPICVRYSTIRLPFWVYITCQFLHISHGYRRYMQSLDYARPPATIKIFYFVTISFSLVIAIKYVRHFFFFSKLSGITKKKTVVNTCFQQNQFCLFFSYSYNTNRSP